MAFRRYRRRRFNGRKRSYRRSMYRARRMRRRPFGRRRTYRNRLWTRKSGLGAKTMTRWDTGHRWKASGSHLGFAVTTPTLPSAESYYTQVVCNAPYSWSDKFFPTGMKEMSLRFGEYRCNGGKLVLKILNANMFGFTIYHKLCRVSPDVTQIDEMTEFLAMEENDLEHGHGVLKSYCPTARYDNDGTTLRNSSRKLVQRFRTRDVIRGISTMNDQWRVFEYPQDPAWNDAAVDCDPLKDSNGNWQQTSFYWCLRYVCDKVPNAAAAWQRQTFTLGQNKINHTWKVRYYCQYRKPREFEANINAPNSENHGTGEVTSDTVKWVTPE